MKQKKLLLPLLFSLLFMTSCKGNNNAGVTNTLDAPTNFTFNFETSTYSFKGSEHATFYSLKVYQYVDSVLDSHAVASSGMIKASESMDFTGTLDYAFTAGNYRAVVKAIAPRYKANQTEVEGTSKLLGAPTVSAKWNDPNSSGGPGGGMMPPMAAAPDDSKEMSIDVTITAGDAITKDYTVSLVNMTSGKEVYKKTDVKAGSLNLKAADLTGVEELTDDDDYQVSVYGNAFDDYVQAKTVTADVVASGNGFTFKISSFKFEKGAKTFTFNLGKTEMMKQATATLMDAPNENALYSYSVMKKTGAPFNLEGTLDILNDNTVKLNMASVGPVQGGNFTSTWTEEDGKIVVSKMSKA